MRNVGVDVGMFYIVGLIQTDTNSRQSLFCLSFNFKY